MLVLLSCYHYKNQQIQHLLLLQLYLDYLVDGSTLQIEMTHHKHSVTDYPFQSHTTWYLLKAGKIIVSVGGTHNVLVHFVLDSAPNLSSVVLPLQPFQMREVCCSVLIKNYTVCVPAITVKWILCSNHRYRKVVGGRHNVLVHYVDDSAPNLSSAVLSNPFKWDSLLIRSDQKLYCLCACNNSEMNFMQQPQV